MFLSQEGVHNSTWSKTFFKYLIQCHYVYACSMWYNGLIQVLKNKLQTTQNKLIQFVINLDYRSRLGKDNFKFLNCLPVDKRVEQMFPCYVLRRNRV